MLRALLRRFLLEHGTAAHAGILHFALFSVMVAAGSPSNAGAWQGNRESLYLRVGTIDTTKTPNLLTQAPGSFESGRPHVLQLDGPVTPIRRAALAAEGITLGAYLPIHAYLVELGRVPLVNVERLGFVRWVGLYKDSWKLDPMIGRRLIPFQSPDRIELQRRGRFRLTVVLFDGRDLQRARGDLAASGAEILAGLMVGQHGVITLNIDAKLVPGLATKSYVQFVEEAPEVTLRNSTTRWIVQSNILDVTPLYDNGLTGQGQIVGIMDGRIDVNHCSFLDGNPIGSAHRKIEAYNTSLGTNFHGTHVAGTAVGDGGLFDNTRGIAFDGRLVFDIVPLFTDASMYNHLQTHHDQGARIHTNSWGDDGTTDYNSLCRGIDRFSRDFEESLVLFAETNTALLKNPENAKNLLAVGASRDTPSQGSHCTGGIGPTSDGRRKPEIFAPGCGTSSSRWLTSCSSFPLTGTSMACPAVAGVAMLVRQYFTDGYYRSGMANPSDGFTPSAALIKAMLLNSAADMTGIAGYPSDREGWGRVLADDALFFSADGRSLVLLEDRRNVDGLTTNDDVEHEVLVQSTTETLKVTLVWTDVPATAGAGFAAINDLDLEVTSPRGQVYLGNVFSGGASVSGGTNDDRNNVEQVHVLLPESGTWTLRIRGAAVNESTQGFALVATGDLARQCADQSDCYDANGCTQDACPDGLCVYTLIPDCIPCAVDPDCDDSEFCTQDTCNPANVCEYVQLRVIYGDVDGTGTVDIDDVLCVLSGFAAAALCPPGDIFPCEGNGLTDIDDVIAILAAFAELQPCPDPCP